MSTLPRSSAAAQSVSDADCRHSRQPFDAAFRCINERRDIGAAAKLVHAHLVSIHRTGRDETQAEIGEALGMSRHQVWAAIQQLVAADLVQTIRYGLGRPNGYVLLGLDQETLDGKAGPATGGRASRPVVAGRAGTPARAFNSEKEKAKKSPEIAQENTENSRGKSENARSFLATRSHEGTDYYATRGGGRLPR